MKRRSLVMAFIFASMIGLAGVLRAEQASVTVVLTNQCQVTGFLVSQSPSNLVVSLGGGQRMTFATSEISSFTVTEPAALKSSGAVASGGRPPDSGGNSHALTHITLGLTNGSLLSGLLISQSSSNFVVSLALDERTNIARSKVSWSELKTNTPVPISPPGSLLGAQALLASNSIAAEFNKPHSEDEMRAMLRTPEGAALLKSVCDEIIGPGADPATKAATETYFKTMQEFADGKIGIVELQVQAQTALGTLSQGPAQTGDDAQADRWNAFKEILQSFVSEPAQAAPPTVQ
ncbi:MAG TPA: hypothetical protein VK731_04200 [Candidatus Cybelea sp.]|nr:hypothetical protein [Candidatus Cybelea sp.]